MSNQEKLRILVIGAHPADIFDQSGGTMAHHVKRGDWVGALVVTHGARIHDKVISNNLFTAATIPQGDKLENMMKDRADVKTEEVFCACEILGVKREDVHFLGEDDAVTLESKDTIRKIAQIIRKLRPNVIITHFPMENGGVECPHANTGKNVMRAIFWAGSVDPEDPNPANKVAQVFFFGGGAAWVRGGLWDSLHGYTNDVFIDITDVVELKLKAIDSMVSQAYAGAYARKRIECSDGAFGQRAGTSYAEPFIKLYAELHEYLPVTEDALKLSRMSDHEIIIRRSYKLKTD